MRRGGNPKNTGILYAVCYNYSFRGNVFISVYLLAVDAKPERVMMWPAENI